MLDFAKLDAGGGVSVMDESSGMWLYATVWNEGARGTGHLTEHVPVVPPCATGTIVRVLVVSGMYHMWPAVQLREVEIVRIPRDL